MEKHNKIAITSTFAYSLPLPATLLRHCKGEDERHFITEQKLNHILYSIVQFIRHVNIMTS